MSKDAKKIVLRNFAPRERRHVYAAPGADGRTQGQYKNDCDINVIVNTFKRSDDPFPTNRAGASPRYVDLPENTDLQSALQTVADASNAFEALPSHIRERYRNNPVEFLGALRNPSERSFLLDSGVLDLHEMPELPSERLKKMSAPTGPKTPPKTEAE